MDKKDQTVAARYFYRNCAVTVYLSGELEVSTDLQLEPGDRQLNREFTLMDDESAYINPRNEFCTFLNASSGTNASMIKKLSAIGYLLCNKLPRNVLKNRQYGFICVNEKIGACCNGKTLFTQAIAQFLSCDRMLRFWARNPFALSSVNEATQAFIVYELTAKEKLTPFYELVTCPWVINRKGLPTEVIPQEKAPHLILISQAAASELPKTGSFKRRFVPLEFSSFWNIKHTPYDRFGHALLVGWDAEQWNLFDNFMFYCVREYLSTYRNNSDIFRLYS